MPPKPREVVRVLHKVGFQKVRQTGSHLVMARESDDRQVVVPMHPRELPKGTFSSILKKAGLTLEEFNQLKRGGGES